VYARRGKEINEKSRQKLIAMGDDEMKHALVLYLNKGVLRSSPSFLKKKIFEEITKLISHFFCEELFVRNLYDFLEK
jgi:hypothetical protein